MRKYVNGNYMVTIHDNGTKVRVSMDDSFVPLKPETIDVNISNYCTNGCEFCYINATDQGKHGNLMLPFFDTIQKHTEIAINFAYHPDIHGFLERMKEKQIIVNMTINQKDLFKPQTFSLIERWKIDGLINALGISITEEPTSELKQKIKYLWYRFDKNIVLHFIVGIVSYHCLSEFANEGYNALFLGYKTKGRAVSLATRLIGDVISPISFKRQVLKDSFITVREMFNVVAYDNLALQQLDLKSKVTSDEWERYYMGDEGCFSMYIDTVSETFAVSSTHETSYPIKSHIIEMFNHIKKEVNQ